MESMKIRPQDGQGDILPVLSSSDMLRGAPAAALLVKERLKLFAGEWWENPGAGNAVLEMLRESRLTGADTQLLSNYLSGYIRKTPGVLEVREVKASVENRRFSFSCTVETAEGSAEITYML